MKSQIAQTPRGPVEYTLQGSGPLVLVCHGTSSDCFSTALASPLVSAGFTVLTPSRPGYGRTPLAVGRSAAEAAAGLIALLDSIGAASCAVLAISGGGPTGAALAALFPQRVTHLVLAAAITHPEIRENETAYKDQVNFYGPVHNTIWSSLNLISRLSPDCIVRQTMAIFSTHDTEDCLRQISHRDIEQIARFYQGHSSRQGALNDLTHKVGVNVLSSIYQPVLVIHSREDKSVPFAHAKWSLRFLRRVQLCEAGVTGHFFWVGPDQERIASRLAAFLKEEPVYQYQIA